MTDFVMNPKVGADPRPDITDTALMDAAGAKAHFTQDDLGKAVKLGADSSYQICTADDEIEGFVVAVEPFTVNSGHSFGSVQRNQRTHAVVSTDNPSVGDYVVAEAQAVLNTMNTLEVTGQTRHMPLVKVIADASEVVHKWRILSVIRTAGAGKAIVTIERV
ncbi:hypothetical protein [Endozoicomonas sp. ALC066]|uniref:hypothetical protein n=1 Tax=Endozoicomonas sp. ALC066 TaxID=3403078 RepID=UPI003BB6A702